MSGFSERAKTHAARHLPDNVPEAVKSARLQEVIATFREGLAARFASRIGALELVRFQGTAQLYSCVEPRHILVRGGLNVLLRLDPLAFDLDPPLHNSDVVAHVAEDSEYF